MTTAEVSIIVPAYNEADRIADTIASLRRARPTWEIVVVDDGSTDATARRAAAADHIVRCQRNHGKGGALRRGVMVARADTLLFVDADLADSAGETVALAIPVLEGRCDMTIAVFPPASRRGGFGLAKRMARWGVRRCTGRDIREPLSGQRALTRALYDRVGGLARGYSVETALTIDALRAGARVEEIELPLSHREMGRGWRGFMHRGRQWRAVAWAVLPRLLRRR